MKIIIPIGISGSGKSTKLRNHLINDYDVLVCPDEIRFKLTGNISDQSKNKEVFEIVDLLIDGAVKQNKNVFLDATNVNTKNREKLVNKYEDNPNVVIQYYILPADVKVSYERIQNDLKNGINRSNVSMEVLERQYKMYCETLSKLMKNKNIMNISILKF